MEPIELLKNYGFWATLIWSAIETDVIFLLVGAFVHAGYMNPYTCFPAACLGAILHDTVVFWLACNNAEWVRSKETYQKIGPKIERLALKVGYWELALCRPMYGTRYPSLLFWGLQKLSYARFYLANGSGLLIWAAGLTALGFIFGDQIESLKSKVAHFQKTLLVSVVLLILLVVAWKHFQKRRTQNSQDTA